MSHQKKIEQVLDLLINEEHDAASELLHSVIVEKARTMYEELVDEEFGGDAKEDFADEIEADKDEIEVEEIMDDEDVSDEEPVDADDADVDLDDVVDADDDDDAEEGEVEDRVEDLEAQLAELRAEFDALVGEEEMEPEHMGDPLDGDVADMDGAMDDDSMVGAGEPDMYEESYDELDEATKLQDEVKGKVLDSEGKLSGTGKNSKAGATNTKAPFTKAPSQKDHGGKAHKIGGADESGKKAALGKDNTPEDNINVPQKKQSAKTENGEDKGSKSPLGSKSSPKGA